MRTETSAWILAAIAALATSLASRPASAAQTLEVRDGDTALARISLRDQTRIRVDRGRITDVLGDIHDPAANPAGRLAMVRDESDGEVYVKPMPAAPGVPGADGVLAAPPFSTPVKLDVKTDRGTFALLLQPADVVGDTLVLRPVGSPKPPAAGEQRRAATHERGIKALTLSMVNPGLDAALQTVPVAGGGQEVALWREARFVLRQVSQAAGLVGQAYELTNLSGKRMVIDERELYREGVVAVAVRRLALVPGETTAVWIVRQDTSD